MRLLGRIIEGGKIDSGGRETGECLEYRGRGWGPMTSGGLCIGV